MRKRQCLRLARVVSVARLAQLDSDTVRHVATFLSIRDMVQIACVAKQFRHRFITLPLLRVNLSVLDQIQSAGWANVRSGNLDHTAGSLRLPSTVQSLQLTACDGPEIDLAQLRCLRLHSPRKLPNLRSCTELISLTILVERRNLFEINWLPLTLRTFITEVKTTSDALLPLSNQLSSLHLWFDAAQHAKSWLHTKPWPSLKTFAFDTQLPETTLCAPKLTSLKTLVVKAWPNVSTVNLAALSIKGHAENLALFPSLTSLGCSGFVSKKSVHQGLLTLIFSCHMYDWEEGEFLMFPNLTRLNLANFSPTREFSKTPLRLPPNVKRLEITNFCEGWVKFHTVATQVHTLRVNCPLVTETELTETLAHLPCLKTFEFIGPLEMLDWAVAKVPTLERIGLRPGDGKIVQTRHKFPDLIVDVIS